jgi:steroid delta-isomerase-like uncharacterized protein
MEIGRRSTRKRRGVRAARPLLVGVGVALVAAGAGLERLRTSRQQRGSGDSVAEANKAVSRRLIADVFNTGRLELIDELVSEGFVGHDAAAPAPLTGRAGVRDQVAGYLSAFPDVAVTIEDQVAERDRVVTRWRARGTHEGELFGIGPTGKQATITGITIDRIVDGRIVESWNSWDTFGTLQQLGAVPEPARA